MFQGLADEPAGRGQVPSWRGHDVDDLAELVHYPVQIGPPSGDPHVGFIDEPPLARTVPARPRGVDEARCEPLHPPADRHLIDLDTALSEQRLDVPVGQAVSQVPAHRDGDDLRREPEPPELRPGQRLTGPAGAHAPSLLGHRTVAVSGPVRRTQQSH